MHDAFIRCHLASPWLPSWNVLTQIRVATPVHPPPTARNGSPSHNASQGPERSDKRTTSCGNLRHSSTGPAIPAVLPLLSLCVGCVAAALQCVIDLVSSEETNFYDPYALP